MSIFAFVVQKEALQLIGVAGTPPGADCALLGLLSHNNGVKSRKYLIMLQVLTYSWGLADMDT